MTLIVLICNLKLFFVMFCRRSCDNDQSMNYSVLPVHVFFAYIIHSM